MGRLRVSSLPGSGAAAIVVAEGRVVAGGVMMLGRAGPWGLLAAGVLGLGATAYLYLRGRDGGGVAGGAASPMKPPDDAEKSTGAKGAGQPEVPARL